MAFRTSIVVLLALGLFVPARADAQATDHDREAARTYMIEGRAHRGNKELQAALESFRSADSLMHYPTTGVELARAHADLGQLIEARTVAQRVVAIPVMPSEAPPFQKARERATMLLQELNERIPTLRVIVEGAPGPGLTVMLDERSLPMEVAAQPQPVDPGHHFVVLHVASGDVRGEADVEERAARDITLVVPPIVAPPLEAAVVAPEPPVEAPAAAPLPVPWTSPKRPWSRPLMFSGLAVAAAGAVAGTITGALAISETSSDKMGCPGGKCTAAAYGSLGGPRTLAEVSNTSFVFAGAGAAAALIGFLARPKEEAHPDSASLTPWLGLGAAGVRGVF